MDCKSIINLIEELTDPREAGAEPRAHLATCSSCSRLYSQRVRLFELVRDSGSVSLSPSFDGKVWARLNESPVKPATYSIAITSHWRLGRALAFGAVALSICGVFLVFRAQSGVPASATAIHKATELRGLDPLSLSQISSLDEPEKMTAQDISSVLEKDLSGGKHQAKVSARNRITHQTRATIVGNYAVRAARVRALHESVGASDILFASQSVNVPVYGGELKVAVSDGGGNQKTLAVLPVTFGSQKILSNKESRYVPVADQGIW